VWFGAGYSSGMMMFWIGLAFGVMLTIPLAWFAARRTERRVRRLVRRARAAERLAELGTLTGGLAHEIKNPLSTINLNIQLLQEDLQQLAGEPLLHEEASSQLARVLRRFETLGRETQRLREILEDFLKFAGRMKLDLKPLDLHALVEELADFFSPQATAAHINIRTQLAPPPRDGATVLGDASLLKQAILNLLINAAQAMMQAREDGQPSGGNSELILRTERRKIEKHSEWRIHVTDTGPGITSQQAERIFQPYISTKKGGTGLGLPTARRIIEEHGGSLTVHAEPGRGSDFVITLPAHAPESSLPPAQSDTSPATSASEA